MFLGCRRAGRLIGVLPAYRFVGPLGAILTSVPQAGPLGGVACVSEVDRESAYAALLSALVQLGTRADAALATVIGNPFWSDEDLLRRHLEPDFEMTNVAQVLDLANGLDDEGRMLGATEGLRRNLRKALSGALVIDEEQTRGNVEAWYQIHVARHREIGATPLPEAMFSGALTHMVPADKARFFFVRLADSGEMVGGGFYVYHGSVIDALMPSIETTHARLGTAFLLAHHTMRWARARGLRFYNWQPSPPDSGVYRFKRQWGSQDVKYGYFTRITGDAEPFLRSTPEVIRAGYPWHYALPFDRVGAGRDVTGPSERRGAWNALEARR
jgi:hypothetical protein